MGIWNLSTRCPTRPTAEDSFKGNDQRPTLLKDTGLDLDALLQSHDALLTGRNAGSRLPKGPTARAGFPDDSDPSLEPTTPRWRPSPLQKRKHLSSEEEEDKSIAAFAKNLAVTFQLLKKDDEDGRKMKPLKARETFDRSLNKFRHLWESVNQYFAIYQKRVPNDLTKIYS